MWCQKFLGLIHRVWTFSAFTFFLSYSISKVPSLLPLKWSFFNLASKLSVSGRLFDKSFARRTCAFLSSLPWLLSSMSFAWPVWCNCPSQVKPFHSTGYLVMLRPKVYLCSVTFDGYLDTHGTGLLKDSSNALISVSSKSSSLGSSLCTIESTPFHKVRTLEKSLHI